MKRNGKYHVYMVQCADGTYYAGYTNHLENRLKLHNSGNGAKYLRGKCPITLVYAKEYRYYKNALRGERELKKLTRKKKEELAKVYARNRQSISSPEPSVDRWKRYTRAATDGITWSYSFDE